MNTSVNIYQSIWLKPFFNDADIYTEKKMYCSRIIGGWSVKRHFYTAWALSVFRLKKHYPNITLVCDTLAKEIFIDILKLPYQNVECCLDSLNHYHPSLWAIGKIKTYSIAKPPFLHLDGDVFIWEKIKPYSAKNELIFQNYEYNEDFYKHSLEQIKQNFQFIPKEISKIDGRENFTCLNAGTIGTNDADFLHEYTEAAFEFVEKNIPVLSKIDIGVFNTVYEQLLCYAIAKKRKMKLTPLFKISKSDNALNFKKRVDFLNVPSVTKYIHPMGFLKLNKFIGAEMEARLELEFPAVYKKILDLDSANLLP